MKERKFNYQADWNTESEMRVYLDSDNPYKLIEEAKEARALLAEKFTQGSEFEDEVGHGVRAYDDPRINAVCAIGAVYYTQGHQVFECNLIMQLNKSAGVLHPVAEYSACGCEICRRAEEEKLGSIVDVNDQQGLEAALGVYDHTIAIYQAEIDLAESFAAEYDRPLPHGHIVGALPPFTYTNTAVTPPATPLPIQAPVKQEVNV